ncbi:MAG: hypothetical protein ABEI86_12055, partial [Halobacteriaceae archaeon]
FPHNYNFLVGGPLHAVGKVKVSHGFYFEDTGLRDQVDKRINASEKLRLLFGVGEPESMRPTGLEIYVPTSATGNVIAKSAA